MIDGCEIVQATVGDVEGILNLQERNQLKHGGTLSARLPRDWLEAAVADMPVIAAKKQGRVVGYLISASQARFEGVPIVEAMLRAYSGVMGDAYVYGPVCVAEEARGHGLAAAMFAMLRAQLPGREGVLFIRHDNAASLRAHEKMGMREVAQFAYRGANQEVLAYIG